MVAPTFAREAKKQSVLVFAAASLTNVLGEISPLFEKKTGARVKLAFGASSVLAKQIEAGATPDVFVSADLEWMDYLQTRKLIDGPSRRDVAGNRLVLIAPADSKVELSISPGFKLAHALEGGRLAVGDPDSVPAGKYAREALLALGVWDEIANRLVRADNVRTALMFVARGEAPLGIVYRTDAAVEPGVRIAGVFPEGTHEPITYPAALTTQATNAGRAYLDFLSRAEARAVWTRQGFRAAAAGANAP